METQRNKLLGWAIILAAALLVGLVLPMLVFAASYQENSGATAAWTPPAGSSGRTPIPTLERRRTSTRSAGVSPAPGQMSGCVHSVTYWTAHPEIWPARVSILEYSYTKDAAAGYFASNSMELPVRLFIQLHAAYLNFNNGAPDPAVKQVIQDSAAWLKLHLRAAADINQADWTTGLALGMGLADYNNGRLDPPPCTGDPIEAQVDELGYATLTPTPTPVPSITLSPTRTLFIATLTRPATGTRFSDTPRPGPVSSPTPSPTQPPTSLPTTALPSDTPLPTPVPSDTPLPEPPTPVPSDIPLPAGPAPVP